MRLLLCMGFLFFSTDLWADEQSPARAFKPKHEHTQSLSQNSTSKISQMKNLIISSAARSTCKEKREIGVRLLLAPLTRPILAPYNFITSIGRDFPWWRKHAGTRQATQIAIRAVIKETLNIGLSPLSIFASPFYFHASLKERKLILFFKEIANQNVEGPHFKKVFQRFRNHFDRNPAACMDFFQTALPALDPILLSNKGFKQFLQAMEAPEALAQFQQDLADSPQSDILIGLLPGGFMMDGNHVLTKTPENLLGFSPDDPQNVGNDQISQNWMHGVKKQYLARLIVKIDTFIQDEKKLRSFASVYETKMNREQLYRKFIPQPGEPIANPDFFGEDPFSDLRLQQLKREPHVTSREWSRIEKSLFRALRHTPEVNTAEVKENLKNALSWGTAPLDGIEKSQIHFKQRIRNLWNLAGATKDPQKLVQLALVLSQNGSRCIDGTSECLGPLEAEAAGISQDNLAELPLVERLGRTVSSILSQLRFQLLQEFVSLIFPTEHAHNIFKFDEQKTGLAVLLIEAFSEILALPTSHHRLQFQVPLPSSFHYVPTFIEFLSETYIEDRMILALEAAFTASADKEYKGPKLTESELIEFVRSREEMKADYEDFVFGETETSQFVERRENRFHFTQPVYRTLLRSLGYVLVL